MRKAGCRSGNVKRRTLTTFQTALQNKRTKRRRWTGIVSVGENLLVPKMMHPREKTDGEKMAEHLGC